MVVVSSGRGRRRGDDCDDRRAGSSVCRPRTGKPEKNTTAWRAN